MKQSAIFLRGEGDKWYRRNISKSREPDLVFSAIKNTGFKPRNVLEVGCGNGWRLQKIRDEFGARCFGIDPSKDAINDAPKDDGIKCWRGTADKLLGVRDGSIDLVIYGFCLYVADREDLFRIVAECDRVLRTPSLLIIHDFYSRRPYSRAYEHKEGVRSYKMDYGRLWTANPLYRAISRTSHGTDTKRPTSPDDEVSVYVIRKDTAADAFPSYSEVDRDSGPVFSPSVLSGDAKIDAP